MFCVLFYLLLLVLLLQFILSLDVYEVKCVNFDINVKEVIFDKEEEVIRLRTNKIENKKLQN